MFKDRPAFVAKPDRIIVKDFVVGKVRSTAARKIVGFSTTVHCGKDHNWLQHGCTTSVRVVHARDAKELVNIVTNKYIVIQAPNVP